MLQEGTASNNPSKITGSIQLDSHNSDSDLCAAFADFEICRAELFNAALRYAEPLLTSMHVAGHRITASCYKAWKKVSHFT